MSAGSVVLIFINFIFCCKFSNYLIEGNMEILKLKKPPTPTPDYNKYLTFKEENVIIE